MEVMSMINYFLHSALFLLIFNLDFDRIQLAERVRILFKISSNFLQYSEPSLLVRTVSLTLACFVQCRETHSEGNISKGQIKKGIACFFVIPFDIVRYKI